MDDSEISLAVVGATGLAGGEIVSLLEETDIGCRELRLFGSADSAGEVYSVRGEEVVVEELREDSFHDIDVAVFATREELSRRYVPRAVEAGAIVIDNSAAFRALEDVPLVVPEVNLDVIKPEHRIIANAIGVPSQLALLLKEIDRVAGLERVLLSTYHSVADAGRQGLDELWSQGLAVFNQKEVVVEAFLHQIAYNCIPQVDVMLEDGWSREERSIVSDLQRILKRADLRMMVTSVRVPVFHSTSLSVSVETRRPLSPRDLTVMLADLGGLFRVYEVPADYPMPLEVNGTEEIHVGRIRRDESVTNGLALWLVSDNVKRGIALNSLAILKHLRSQRH